MHSARPVVVLNNIRDDNQNERRTTETPPSSSSSSSEPNNNSNTNGNQNDSSQLGKIQEEIALNELKYKQTLRENEAERMEFEREIYRKQIMLLDLKIKKNNLQIDYYMKEGN